MHVIRGLVSGHYEAYHDQFGIIDATARRDIVEGRRKATFSEELRSCWDSREAPEANSFSYRDKHCLALKSAFCEADLKGCVRRCGTLHIERVVGMHQLLFRRGSGSL
jgi:hypothetical protein